MKPYTFWPMLEKIKKPTPKKIPYISGNGNLKKASYNSRNGTFQSTPRKFLILQETKTPEIPYIMSKESCSYILGNGNPEKILYISGNGTFLYFGKSIFKT